MRVRLSRAHFPVTTLGPGRRLGLWLQGCSIGCTGCIARDTWDEAPEREIEVDALLGWCRDVTRDALDGVTISGGEPFDQPAALAILLEGLDDWRAQLKVPFDILCYSGHPLGQLEARHPQLLARLDALIPEPYVERRPLGGPWRGSDNQPLVVLSDLGGLRFPRASVSPTGARDRLQVTVSDGAVWYVGIPRRGDLEKVRRVAAARGVLLRGASWLA